MRRARSEAAGRRWWRIGEGERRKQNTLAARLNAAHEGNAALKNAVELVRNVAFSQAVNEFPGDLMQNGAGNVSLTRELGETGMREKRLRCGSGIGATQPGDQRIGEGDRRTDEALRHHRILDADQSGRFPGKRAHFVNELPQQLARFPPTLVTGVITES